MSGYNKGLQIACQVGMLVLLASSQAWGLTLEEAKAELTEWRILWKAQVVEAKRAALEQEQANSAAGGVGVGAD